MEEVTDIVPTYLSVTVYLKTRTSDPGKTVSEIDRFLNSLDIDECVGREKSENGRETVIPVDYSGPDLERVAQFHHITTQRVIEWHSGASYRVAMIGFKPYFPYLIGLPSELETPRLETPRTAVPAGAVAVGGAQAGIYPEVSPGGWNLLGMTDPALLKSLRPGDRIRFRPITKTKGDVSCL